jgi:hypothetical protein
MALPDRDVAMTWGGKMLVDRDGAEIGRVRQMYTDDATGRPEWATAVLGGSTLFVPLLDATESDGRVRLTVRRDDVVRAPSVGDVQHISEDEEAMLYRHYGIAYSRDASKTLLPAAVAEGAGRRSGSPRLRGWVGGQENVSASDGGTRMLMILIAAAVAGVLALIGTVAVVFRRMRTTRQGRRRAAPVARVADQAGAVADAATTAASTAASAATSAAASAVGSAASAATRQRRRRRD